MMQQHPAHEAKTTWTKEELEMPWWSQMAWFVLLGRTTANFDSMPGWEQLKWKEEFATMSLRADSSAIPVPADTKRYPRGEETEYYGVHVLPTLEEMQQVRHVITRHLNELADGKGTFLGPFTISFSVNFHHVHDAYGKQKTPRHVIYRGESDVATNIYLPTLLRHLTRLLETYCDQIRRCPHCRHVFLQNRSHQQYCSRGCQSVAVMQKRRTEEKAKSKKKPTNKRQGLTASQRRRARHGTKRR